MKTKIRHSILVVFLMSCLSSQSQEIKPTQIFQKNSKSVVLIVTFDAKGNAVAQGSGVVLSGNMVATNCHVVSKSRFIGVELDEQRRFAKVTANYPDSDLCVLTLNAALGQPVRLAAEEPQAGEKVYALGHPRGLDLTISEGLISGFRSTPHGKFLQISAPISSGSSGGGLFDSRGYLVGITTLSLRGSQNINFAAPVGNLIKESAKAKNNNPPSDTQRNLSESGNSNAFELITNAPPAPDLSVMSAEDRVKYLKWLDRQLDRLGSIIPDLEARRGFLQAAWYESKRASLEPDFVLAVIQSLSNYRKYYVSDDGARGFMQVLPKWTRVIRGGDSGKLFHMQTNLRFGCILLRHYTDIEKGDLAAGLNTYLVEVAGVKLDGAERIKVVESIFLAREKLNN